MANIYPINKLMIQKNEQEILLNQKAKVYWLFGPSGSGKSTIALSLQKKLYEDGKYAILLDGDNIRSGLNAGLGFSTEDRMENIRRAAELAKILVQNGAIVICCFVCPLKAMRDLARDIIGEDFTEIYIKTSLETLIQRDTKGFYKKALAGKMENLTGVNSEFEEGDHSDLIIDTDKVGMEESVNLILNFEYHNLKYQI